MRFLLFRQLFIQFFVEGPDGLKISSFYRVTLPVRSRDSIRSDCIREWYQKAASQGDVLGQNRLGLIYLKGLGVKQDFSQTAKWWKLASFAFLSVL